MDFNDMTIEEVNLLLDLIQSKKVLTKRDIDPANIESKEAAWVTITAEFNSQCGFTVPEYNMTQLKRKWNELQKAFRESQKGTNVKVRGAVAHLLKRVATIMPPIEDTHGDEDGEPSTSKRPVRAMKRRTFAKHKHRLMNPILFCVGRGCSEYNGTKEKNLAIAKYYNKLSDKLDLEMQFITKPIFGDDTETSSSAPVASSASSPHEQDDDAGNVSQQTTE